MIDKLSDIWNFIKNHPMITFFLLLPFMIIPVMGISDSISLWDKHPVRFVCNGTNNKCKLITYNYEHKICWDYIRSSYRKYYYRKVKECKLPKYSDSEKELLYAYDIANFIVKEYKNSYNLYVVDKKGRKILLNSYKRQETAEHYLNELQKQLNKRKNPIYKTNIYGDYVQKNDDVFDYYIN